MPSGCRLGPRWAEFVEPRGPWTYEAKVVVAVDRFSVSMAKGFAMAMDGMKRGTVVGTRMAGLGAAIDRVELPGAGITAQISTGSRPAAARPLTRELRGPAAGYDSEGPSAASSICTA
jgi:hypothetical protein